MAITCSQDGNACLLQLQTGRVLATLTHAETSIMIGDTDAEEARNSVEWCEWTSTCSESTTCWHSFRSAGFCKSMNWAATGCLGGLLRIWDLASHQVHNVLCLPDEIWFFFQCRHTCRHEGGVIKLLWHPTEAIVYTCTTTGLIYAWDARSGSQLKIWQGHSEMILDMAFVMNGGHATGILTASDDQTVRMFSLSN